VSERCQGEDAGPARRSTTAGAESTQAPVAQGIEHRFPKELGTATGNRAVNVT